ncbi:MAG: helix-turn-helix transcriptional regulator [Bacteroidaceae bacterium]|nr:helix-turn-helix transcriptional regulator [Bacteroidaceae bacterium]
MKDRIRMLMQKAGMTQKDFANCLQISEASLSSIFNGRTNPTNTHVCAVHKAFPDVNINWLLFGEGEISEEFADGADAENAVLKPTPSAPGSVSEVRPAEPAKPAFGVKNEPLSVELAMPVSVLGSVSNAVIESEKKCDKTNRKVKEIRIFYDDGTYEIFIPAVK